MKKSVKATLLAGAIAFSAINAANAMSPRERSALEKTQISAAQALSAAQAKIGADAKVKDIDFKHTLYGKDYFQVKILANGQKHKVDVDAENGQILGMETKTSKKIKVSPNGDVTPRVTFAQAMEIAVAKTGGKHKHGQAFYKIETVANGQQFVVAVDADNGQLIDMPKKGKDKHHRNHVHRENGHEGGFRQP